MTHGGHHHDTNLRAAYVHVLADALISVLTIAGLSAAWAFGWKFMDPLVGLVGMVVIAILGAEPAARRRLRAARHRSRSASCRSASASASRPAATGWPTCMCGSSGPAMPR